MSRGHRRQCRQSRAAANDDKWKNRRLGKKSSWWLTEQGIRQNMGTSIELLKPPCDMYTKMTSLKQ